jgi:hypothetical protein
VFISFLVEMQKNDIIILDAENRLWYKGRPFAGRKSGGRQEAGCRKKSS